MQLDLTSISYLAVVVTGIVVFLIGGIWYQALFGRLWVKLHNLSDEDIKRMQQRIPPQIFFPVMLGAYLVMAFAIAMLVTSFDINDLAGGMILGAVLWLIVASIGVTAHITSDKHIGIYAIDTAYQLVIFLVAGSMLGAWQ